ncbi:hypothetical protein Tco_0310826, partial [Tanacetum coccineum]
LIQVLKIHTDENVADLLTKAFDGPRFAYLVVHIGMVNPSHVYACDYISTIQPQSKSSTNKVKSGFSSAYSTCTPSTSSTNIPEKEDLAGFADEVIYSLVAKQSKDWDLLHEDLEQIDDVDIEEMDINWQIALIAIRMKKFYKKT